VVLSDLRPWTVDQSHRGRGGVRGEGGRGEGGGGGLGGGSGGRGEGAAEFWGSVSIGGADGIDLSGREAGGPYVFAKEPYRSTQEPYGSAKEPYFSPMTERWRIETGVSEVAPRSVSDRDASVDGRDGGAKDVENYGKESGEGGGDEEAEDVFIDEGEEDEDEIDDNTNEKESYSSLNPFLQERYIYPAEFSLHRSWGGKRGGGGGGAQ